MSPLCAALLLAASPISLQSLVPTSGGDAAALLDSNADTKWLPSGDPAGEGVLFRFEQIPPVSFVEVRRCPDSNLELGAYFDGRRDSETFRFDKQGKARVTPNFQFRSLFLKIESAKGSACLAEVNFGGVKVQPPRTAHGSVTVSSTLAPEDAYHAGYLFDGRTDFGWVEGS